MNSRYVSPDDPMGHVKDYLTYEELHDTAVIPYWRDGNDDLKPCDEPINEYPRTREHYPDSEWFSDRLYEMIKAKPHKFSVMFIDKYMKKYGIDYKIVLGKSGFIFTILADEDPDVIKDKDMRWYDEMKWYYEAVKTDPYRQYIGLMPSSIVEDEHKKDLLERAKEVSSSIKDCYDKAMRIGESVPWRDTKYIDPRYVTVITTFAHSGKIQEIHTQDALDVNLPEHAHNHPFNACFILDKPNDKPVDATISDIIDTKLFIGNGGAFYFVKPGQDMDILKELDKTFSCEGYEIGDKLTPEEMEPPCFKYISDVSLSVFKEYLKAVEGSKTFEDCKPLGETSLF